MRCSCPKCGVYMVQAEDMTLGCICPNCFTRCNACLGTNSIISKDSLKEIKDGPWFGFDEPETVGDDDIYDE